MKHLKAFYLLIFSILYQNAFAQNRDMVKEYIKQNAISIDTNYASDDLNDLIKLKATFQDRRIIGLGEATHGTHDFQALKFRMFRFLVTDMGYKLFGIEANFAACRVVNEYILDGRGDPKNAIIGLRFWTWRTTDLLNMVEWMRQYNIGKPADQKIKFYGFDMQLERYSLSQLIDKLKKFNEPYFKEHFAKLLTLKIYDDDKNIFTKYSDDETDSVKALITNVADYIKANEDTLSKLFSKDEIIFTERDITLLEQCLEEGIAANKSKTSSVLQNDVRDKYMAENIQWILDHEGANSKIMIWAHNRHIDKFGGNFSNLGSHLKNLYNDQYYAIGFDFNSGSFNAFDTKTSGVKTFTVQFSKPGSSGRLFDEIGLPVFFINMEELVKTNPDLKKFFSKNIYQRDIGAGYDPSLDDNRSYFNWPLYKLYDGLIFVDKTTATILMKKS